MSFAVKSNPSKSYALLSNEEFKNIYESNPEGVPSHIKKKDVRYLAREEKHSFHEMREKLRQKIQNRAITINIQK